MLIKISKIKAEEHNGTIYRKVHLYGIPCVYRKNPKGNKISTQCIDTKYLKYLENAPCVDRLRSFLSNWIYENVMDKMLQWYFLDELKVMDRFELMRLYIDKKENKQEIIKDFSKKIIN